MAVVKGSKQYRMKVVAYRPWSRFFTRLLGLFIIALAIAGSYLYGDYQGRENQRYAVLERDQLRQQLELSVKESAELRQEVANLKLGSTVDRQSSEEVRNEVIAQRDKIAELEEVISFYKGLMSPTANQRGLNIGSVNVVAVDNRKFEYKVVVQQLATNHQLLNGYLSFTIVGQLNGMPAKLRLMDVSPEVNAENIRLRFKYFQTIDGYLVLPEGFEPVRIELAATSTGSDAVTVEKKFGWLVQES